MKIAVYGKLRAGKTAVCDYIKSNSPNWEILDFGDDLKELLGVDFDYSNLKGISLEARQKLNQFRPVSIGQASRISGISPADISVLLIHLEQLKRK